MKPVFLAFCVAMTLTAGVAQARPKSLAGTSWTVVSVGGAPVATGTKPQIVFGPKGSVSGRGPCNSFGGTWKADASGALSFGQIAANMMACDIEPMQAERTLFDALASVTRYDVTADGHLQLMTGSTVSIVARPQ